MKNTRNNSANVSINSLPIEVLTHIFHLVLAKEPCLLRMTRHWSWGSGMAVDLPRYPDTLSHVCSQWREAAFASHALWSHIDIALSCPLSKGFHDRAATYVARAHEVPLDIHFTDPSRIRGVAQRTTYSIGFEQDSSDSDDYPDEQNEPDDLVYGNNPEEFTFLASSSGPRIRSLGLLALSKYHPIYSRALEHCLSSCSPGGLAELVVNVPSHTPSRSRFFEASPDPQNREDVTSTRLLLSEQQLESAWRSATSLVLGGRYPRWASAAYHKLTELRLLGRMRISSSELAGILRSSPGLRILYCDSTISDSPRPDSSTFSIALQELETLNLKGMDEVHLEYILQRLNPGPKPLRLSLHGNPTSTRLGDFFRRSNVQEMRIESKSDPFGEIELSYTMFYLPSHLRVLVVARWGHIIDPKVDERLAELGLLNNAPPLMEVDKMYLLQCRFDDFQQFQEMVEKYSPRELIIWRCSIANAPRSQPIDSPKEIPKELPPLPSLESSFGGDLSQLSPSIKCSLVGRNPIRGWDSDSDSDSDPDSYY